MSHPDMQSAMDELLPTRHSLLDRLKNWGDDESWQDFFFTYWKLIYQVALKAGLDESAAEEVVQETVIAVAKSIQSFEYDPQRGSFKSWLLTITRRRINDHWRRKYAQPAFIEASGDEDSSTPLEHRMPDEAKNWELIWDQEWERNLLTVALENVKAKVKARQYQLFDCLVLKEWPIHAIREKLHASLAQIYFAKYKVNALLEKELRTIRARWEAERATPGR